ncbi:sensor histidine kinase [Gordonia shandongensis]|uniref:sensor histidine kinase n=1 Tax=Gordonia shandongensis TaxID=376351 RepID=UPI0004003BE6|nr:sensor histidine kinase [Gordonia shandongensis]
MTPPCDSLTAPWRTGRWVFGAVWLVFMVYPILAVAGAGRPTPVTVVGFLTIIVFVIVYLLECVYAMWEPARSPWWRSPATAGFVILLVMTALLVAIIGGRAFAVAPFLMAVVAFAVPVPPAVSLAGIMTIFLSAIGIPEWAGWGVDVGLLVVFAVVGVMMMITRLSRDAEQQREREQERQRELSRQLAVVNERERVARDVHDILGHSLTVITVKTELAARLVDLDPDRAKRELAEVNSLSRDALAEVRATVGALRTPNLDDVLAAASSALSAAGVAADLPPRGTESPHSELFAWVVREAVTNVVRHSGARRCSVTVDETSLTVADDGRGSAVLRYGNGLSGLAERVDAAGGAFSVTSEETGTVVRVDMTADPRRR